jgi:hypothetical protein
MPAQPGKNQAKYESEGDEREQPTRETAQS